MKKFFSLMLSLTILTLHLSNVAFAGSPNYRVQKAGGYNHKFTNAEPNKKLTSAIEISFNDDIRATFYLEFSSVSGHKFALPGSGSVLDMSTWIHFPKGSTIIIDGVKGEKNALIPIEFTLPENIAPGDYEGILTASLTSFKTEEELKAEKEDSGGVGVNFAPAIGIPFTFSVPGEKIDKLKLENFSFAGFSEDNKRDQIVNLAIKYKNLGTVLVRPTMKIVVRNMFNKQIHEKEFILGDIYPGADHAETLLLDELRFFRGWVNLEATFTYSTMDLNGNILKPNIKNSEVNLKIYFIPLSITIFLASLLLISLSIFFYRKYKRNSLLAISSLYIVKNGDTLQSICTKFKVEADNVVFLNKLKMPYFLTPGSKIVIPKIKEK